MSLFDASPYGPESRSRSKAQPKPPIETVAVHADGSWKLVTKDQHGVVHCWVGKNGDTKGAPPGALVGWCGVVGVPHTFTPGEIVLGCRKCLERGAPRRSVAS